MTASVKIALGLLRGPCEDLALEDSLAILKPMQEWATLGIFIPHSNTEAVSDLLKALERELVKRTILCVPHDAKEKYESKMPFGQIVYDAFPEAREDILDASKCFALGHYTACVLHCMRLAEFGVKMLCRGRIKLTDKDNFGDMIVKLDRRLGPTPVPGVPGKTRRAIRRTSLKHIVLYLKQVKDVWRNKSVHDINVRYGKESAKRIFDHVMDLMVYVSERQ
jgi:hypothetical protein